MNILGLQRVKKRMYIGDVQEQRHGECLDPRGSNMFMKVEKGCIMKSCI